MQYIRVYFRVNPRTEECMKQHYCDKFCCDFGPLSCGWGSARRVMVQGFVAKPQDRSRFICMWQTHTHTHRHTRRGQPTHAVPGRQLLLSFSFSFRPDTRLRIIFAFLWLLCLLALLSLSLCSLPCGFLCSPNCLASCLFCALLSIDLYQ